ncbi:hypothetical protein, partial [Mesorhizobium sp. M0643]|uniref:hypothetical protein n=1 Tax=Mesorhizobium sp. M0643 TaxID=2956978 RepID=UPI00333BB802
MAKFKFRDYKRLGLVGVRRTRSIVQLTASSCESLHVAAAKDWFGGIRQKHAAVAVILHAPGSFWRLFRRSDGSYRASVRKEGPSLFMNFGINTILTQSERDAVLALRHDMHREPELSNQEWNTQ